MPPLSACAYTLAWLTGGGSMPSKLPIPAPPSPPGGGGGMPGGGAGAAPPILSASSSDGIDMVGGLTTPAPCMSA